MGGLLRERALGDVRFRQPRGRTAVILDPVETLEQLVAIPSVNPMGRGRSSARRWVKRS